MSSNSATQEVASRFLDLALKHKWNEVEEGLNADEVQVLLDLVRAAGFEAEAVVFGRMRGNYLEQDGTSTGETYPINSLCPFKVVGERGTDHYLATGWLDCALKFARRATEGMVEDSEWRQDRVCALVEVIKESVPLTPIQLTPEGDLLGEYPPSLHNGDYHEYFVTHSRDEDRVSGCVGIHQYCNSWMDRNRATATHDSITCRRCHLRVLFPKEVRTYGDLRDALTSTPAQSTP